MSWDLVRDIAVFTLIGGGVGWMFYTLLAMGFQSSTGDPVSKPLRFMLLYLLRFALAGTVFWLVARQGAAPLLSSLAGFTLARLGLLHHSPPSA